MVVGGANIITNKTIVSISCGRGFSGNMLTKNMMMQLTKNLTIRGHYPKILVSLRRGEWGNCLKHLDSLFNDLRNNGKGMNEVLGSVAGLYQSLFLALKWVHHEILLSDELDNESIVKVMENIDLLAFAGANFPKEKDGLLVFVGEKVFPDYIDLCLDVCRTALDKKADDYLLDYLYWPLHMSKLFSIEQRERMVRLLEESAADILRHDEVENVPDHYAALVANK